MEQSTLLVVDRQTAHIPVLGIKSDREIPENDDGSKPVGWWLAEVADFDGQARRFETGAIQSQANSVAIDGTAAIAVNREVVKGILSPTDNSPALWWTWQFDELSLRTAGSQGLLKKRPTDLWLEHEDGRLHLKAVSRLWRNSGNYQSGQEGSLLKALGDVGAG